jgi:hypothetical protein
MGKFEKEFNDIVHFGYDFFPSDDIIEEDIKTSYPVSILSVENMKYVIDHVKESDSELHIFDGFNFLPSLDGSLRIWGEKSIDPFTRKRLIIAIDGDKIKFDLVNYLLNDLGVHSYTSETGTEVFSVENYLRTLKKIN